ncbi:hypothetical protein [Nonomuraea endophytica]|uniref:hypothetical protein n=1 Tax=Nonomuraea endophytica TaxID=714136 RepID=UPI0037C7719A
MPITVTAWFLAAGVSISVEVVDEPQVSAEEWRKGVRRRSSVEHDRETLARLIEDDHDPDGVDL